MHPAILPAALAFSVAVALAFRVARRRHKTDFHWLFLAVLAGCAVWTLGILFRFSVASEEGLIGSLRVVFLGVFTVPPLWFLLAARYARLPAVLERRSLYVSMLVPSLVGYLALLTNEGHRLVFKTVSFEALAAGTPAWAGPVFWAMLAWAYVCVGAGALLYLSTARRMVANRERQRGLLLAVAAIIPLLASMIYAFRIFPVSFDLTPAGLVVAMVLLSTATFRYRLLESLPLTRRGVIEHLRDGVVIAGAGGAIEDFNPAAEKILGGSAEGLRHRLLADALREFVGDSATHAFRADLENLSARTGPLLFEFLADDGRRIGLTVASVRDGDGEATGQYAVLRDRTEERRYERAVQQTQKLETVGTLVAGIAHEVNNPLAFIRANLAEIQRMGELVEDLRDAPDKLADEVADLSQIAGETLDGIGRIERIVADLRLLSTAQDEAFAPLDLNQVVGDAIRLANLARNPRIAVDARLAPVLPRVRGAPRRLVQALLNLLVNAKHALAQRGGGRIEVATRLVDGSVEIRVRDDGPGIPGEIRERIFDPFFTTKDPDQGTGLGLSISLDILRDHGGSLEFTTGVDGTEFVARVPVRAD